MFILCILLVFVTAFKSEEIPFDESQLHPLSDEYIEYINDVQSLWQAGRNFEVDTPLEYLHRLNGVKRREDPLDIEERQFSVNMIQNLPENFDAREHWPYCPSLFEIRDQGFCGSCWAISATEVMTDRICIASQGQVQFHFSASDLLTCCKKCSIGCDGGHAYLGWKYWIESGIVSGGNFNSENKDCKPYLIPNIDFFKTHYNDYFEKPSLECTHQCVSTDLDYDKDKRFGKIVYSISANEDAIKTEILSHGPVQAIFYVFSDFHSYKSGVYRAVSNKHHGQHAVKILGWGVENGIKYWLAANSWGEHWGDHGFFKIVRGENHCGIEREILAGEPLI